MAGEAGQDAGNGFVLPDVGVDLAWGDDLAAVFEGRRPDITARRDVVVAVSPADPTIGLEGSVVAVSADGEPFREVDLGATLLGMSAVVDESSAVVLGTECGGAMSADAGCEPHLLRSRAFEIDVASGSGIELPDVPDDHLGGRGVGVTERGFAFAANKADGSQAMLTWTGSTWESAPLPFVGSAMCSHGGLLVAVTAVSNDAPPASDPSPAPPGGPIAVPADDSGIDGTRTPPGAPLWNAYVSEDAGRTWSEPFVHPSLIDDVGFAPFAVCGPDHVLVQTLQLAWFDPESRMWVATEGGLDSGPGGAVAYRDDGSSVHWSTPVPPSSAEPDEQPGEPASRRRLSFPPFDGATPRPDATGADLPDGLTLQTTGAAADGYLIVSQASELGYDLIRLT